METIQIPDIVFLILGISVLLVLISIRNQLKRIAGKNRRRRHQEGMSFEEQHKLRVKYLHHNRIRRTA
jgi:hypothetical protein